MILNYIHQFEWYTLSFNLQSVSLFLLFCQQKCWALIRALAEGRTQSYGRAHNLPRGEVKKLQLLVLLNWDQNQKLVWRILIRSRISCANYLCCQFKDTNSSTSCQISSNWFITRQILIHSESSIQFQQNNPQLFQNSWSENRNKN